MNKNKPSQKSTDHGVYKIPCKCCDKFYIGETGRDLAQRLKEHKTDIINRKSHSGVANHVLETSHNFDFEQAKIVYPCSDKRKRHLVESALIIEQSEYCVNLNTGFSPHNKLLAKTICSLVKPIT